MTEQINITGKFRIENTTTGQIVENLNTIMRVGFAQITNLIIADLVADGIGSSYDVMAIGIGSSTIVNTETVLGSEYLRIVLGSVTGSTTTTTLTNDTARFIGSFGTDTTKTINEAGLFNQSGIDLGSMLARTTFAGITAISGDRINIQWDIAFA